METKTLYTTHAGPQTAMLLSNAEEVLYGGAAGGGKSYALRAFAVNYAMSYPDSHGVVFRQSFRQLEDTHLIAIQQEVPSSIARYMTARHDLVFPNGSVVHFRFCEKDEDARTYDSMEMDYVLFDELTHFTEFTYTYITSRCRSTKPWWPGPRIRSGATPLGLGNDWVKARWHLSKDDLEHKQPMEIWTGPVSEGGMTRQFIPAKVTDNKTLFEGDPTYIQRLRALPWEEYQAKALGSWEVFTGQFFQRWRNELHVVQPFDIPPDWERFIGVDYGYSAPYAVLWLARPPGSDIAYVYREHYGKGVSPYQQIRLASQEVADNSERIRAIVLDPSMFSKVQAKGERLDSIASDWDAEFRQHTKVIRGDNSRVPGWRLLRELLDWIEAPDGSIIRAPRLKVFSSCRNLIGTLPNLVIDEHNPEDVDSSGEDHAADALRYGLMHMFRGGSNPKRPGRSLHIGPAGLVVGGQRSVPGRPNGREGLWA